MRSRSYASRGSSNSTSYRIAIMRWTLTTRSFHMGRNTITSEAWVQRIVFSSTATRIFSRQSPSTLSAALLDRLQIGVVDDVETEGGEAVEVLCVGARGEEGLRRVGAQVREHAEDVLRQGGVEALQEVATMNENTNRHIFWNC